MILNYLIDLYELFFDGLSTYYLFPLFCLGFLIFAFNLLINVIRSVTHV